MGKERLESKTKEQKKVECPIGIGFGNHWQGWVRATGSRCPAKFFHFDH